MDGDDRHEMHLEATHYPAAREWACSTCNRRLLMFSDRFEVLEEGDPSIEHFGGSHGVRIGPMTIDAGGPPLQ